MRVLIVDDEPTARKGLYYLLKSEIKDILQADNPDSAVELVGENELDLAIVDLRMPAEEDGLSLVRSIKLAQPLVQVLVMTAFGSVDSAVKAMKAGADDYVTKDFSRDELLIKIHRLLDTRRLKMSNLKLVEEVEDYRARLGMIAPESGIVGDSPAIRPIIDLIRRAGEDNESTVLITGESGTGKELVARGIHQKSPKRSVHKFVVVDIANIPATLLESQLFGHEKGAFTNAHQRHIGLFEKADGGTVFLDEIGDFPLELQTKLLRFLQEKSFTRVGGEDVRHSDVRILAATNKNLEQMVQEHKFREDLYYRLNVIRVQLPPLRERREDIPLLITHFARLFKVQKGRQLEFPEQVIETLTRYEWPGNVRQLRNTLESLYVLCPAEEVRTEDIWFNRGQPLPSSSGDDTRLFDLPLKEARQQILERFESRFIAHHLKKCGGNISKLAQEIGESREGLSKKIKRYGLKESGD
jgi:two-component system response regulator HydG